ncbi:MAG TPA: M1 family aminopeptidase, partial [Thermoguttaceae bacterium]|nr:M1 family aminopeptidase [Thermoguttaceae bacterium]
FCETIDYRYPWPKYAQICVDEYVAGGMEHTSATTLNLGTLHDDRAHLDVSSDSLVAHELVHQWWGDLITCKDWAELWLNEGFAVYFTTLWIEHDQGTDEALWKRYKEAESYFNEDTKRYRRPIVTYQYESPGKMFDSHSYPKAGRVLHMLRFVLGDEAFFKALRHYCKKHAFAVVETADLRTAVEESTGQGLNWFFDQWLYHGGHPEYQVGYEWDQSQKQLTLTVEQTQEVDDLTPLFRMPIEIDFVTDGKRTTRRITVSKREETFHFSLPKRPDRVCFDPRDWVLKKLTLQKSREEWLDQAVAEPNMICRVRAVQQLGAMTDDRSALAILAKAAQDDKFWAVRQKAVEAIAKFGGEDARKTLLAVAKDDPKSFVRREAIKALAKFSHDRTRAALREIIQQDQSYEAVAEALRSLAQVDRTGCRTDLLAALNRPSHKEVILKAAAGGLADTKDPQAVERLLPILDAPAPSRRRTAVLSALAKLGADDPEMLEAIGRQLEDARYSVRSAACTALAETGNPAAIDLLLARRDKETHSRTVRAIDESVEKLRERQTELGKLNEKLESLQQQNRQLEARIHELESKDG